MRREECIMYLQYHRPLAVPQSRVVRRRRDSVVGGLPRVVGEASQTPNVYYLFAVLLSVGSTETTTPECTILSTV